ncbi:MAG: hypothetical protein LQ351_002342 [Letrouitia transgressa]|nr:MAG: hypothetical protein LQ351_002342 [Letrouitia transgressa]
MDDFKRTATDSIPLGALTTTKPAATPPNRDTISLMVSGFNKFNSTPRHHNGQPWRHESAQPNRTLEHPSKNSDPTIMEEDSFGSLLAAQRHSSKQNRLRSPPPSHQHPQSSNPSKLSRRKTSSSSSDDDENRRRRRHYHRSSKHAPTTLSSKKPVSRARPVLPPSTRAPPRDPRFLPLCGPAPPPHLVARNYSFLTPYLFHEISTLKSAILSEKSPEVRSNLQRALERQESRIAAQRAREAEQDVLREHRAAEKAAVASGKRPFYLKKSEQKRAALVRRFEGMKGKEMEKVLARRRKKRAAKERKGMPRERGRNGG